MSFRDHWPVYAAVLLVFLTGLTLIAFPYYGDQALFLIAARKLAAGGLLYKDFWDLKPPGIIAFYTAAVYLFGPGEIAARWLDVLTQVAGAASAGFIVLRHSKRPITAAAAVVFSVWSYFALADAEKLAQVEALVYLPLLWLAFACAESIRQPDRTTRWMALAGLCAAAVFWCKPVFLLFPMGFLAVTFSIRRSLAGLLPFAASFTAAGAAVLGFFAWRGTLDLLIWTCFIFPYRYVRELPNAPIAQLKDAASWWFFHNAACFLLAALGLRRARSPLPMLLAIWLAVGVAVILVQRNSWWNYHFQLLLVPAGMLAAIELDRMISERSIGWRGAAFLAALALIPPSIALLQKWRGLTPGVIAGQPEARQQYRMRYSQVYVHAENDRIALAKLGHAMGPLVVVGDPTVNIALDQDPPIALHTWSPEHYLPEHWRQLEQQLRTARPAYVVIGPNYRRFIERSSPQILAWIDSEYAAVLDGDCGKWYGLKPSRSPLAQRPGPADPLPASLAVSPRREAPPPVR